MNVRVRVRVRALVWACCVCEETTQELLALAIEPRKWAADHRRQHSERRFDPTADRPERTHAEDGGVEARQCLQDFTSRTGTNAAETETNGSVGTAALREMSLAM